MTTECSQMVGQICERMRAVNAENERLREVSRECINAISVIRAENDRYRAALVEITSFCDVRDCEFVDWRYRIKACEQIALNALAVRTESGPLSEDSGPIARCGNCDGTGDVHRADGEWIGACHCQNASGPIAEDGK